MGSSAHATVLFYSRTGNCRAVAESIGQALSCPVQEIRDLKSREGIRGFISGMIDIRRRPITDIEPRTFDVSDRDTIFLGSPIWGMRFAPAITTVLELFDFKGKKVVLFAVVTAKFKQAKIDAYAHALAGKGAQVTGTFVIKTLGKTAEQLQEEARRAMLGIAQVQ